MGFLSGKRALIVGIASQRSPRCRASSTNIRSSRRPMPIPRGGVDGDAEQPGRALAQAGALNAQHVAEDGAAAARDAGNGRRPFQVVPELRLRESMRRVVVGERIVLEGSQRRRIRNTGGPHFDVSRVPGSLHAARVSPFQSGIETLPQVSAWCVERRHERKNFPGRLAEPGGFPFKSALIQAGKRLALGQACAQPRVNDGRVRDVSPSTSKAYSRRSFAPLCAADAVICGRWIRASRSSGVRIATGWAGRRRRTRRQQDRQREMCRCNARIATSDGAGGNRGSGSSSSSDSSGSEAPDTRFEYWGRLDLPRRRTYVVYLPLVLARATEEHTALVHALDDALEAYQGAVPANRTGN